MRPPCLIYIPTSTGVRTGCHYLIRLCIGNIRGFTDCVSCTRPISTNPGSIEAGEYGLTHGTCLVARHLEVVAVAGLMWISLCDWVRRDFVFFFVFFVRTHTTCCKYEAALLHLPLY